MNEPRHHTERNTLNQPTPALEVIAKRKLRLALAARKAARKAELLHETAVQAKAAAKAARKARKLARKAARKAAKNARQHDQALKAFLKSAKADRKPATSAKGGGGKSSSARAVTRRKVKPAFSGALAPAKVASSATSPAAPVNQ
jgi:hypothetical protein